MDGAVYLMPRDKFKCMLYEEVSCHFSDKVDSHIEERRKALKNLNTSGNIGNFLLRRSDSN